MERRPDDDKARPEQTDEGGFEEGQQQRPETDPDVEPDFARGIRTTPQSDVHPRFSEGIEEMPDSAQNNTEGSFATGSDETQEDRH